MARAKLIYTTNEKFSYLVGTEGDLVVTDSGRFMFTFPSRNGGEELTLSSTVKGRLGDPDDYRSKEVHIQTHNSQYGFEKLENYIEKVSYVGEKNFSERDKELMKPKRYAVAGRDER